ncbi:hypothetical protein C1645_480447 [Glomus cerebriforme]|uniref:UvrD-like helicase ATP-binding domain-containing protein n=1 Tax=Glomus cerebriforme TaxID=658196 RepID=A0A397TKY4_9GLOM|nr:hypothetical protein C1645_480447 [Glomus cerebriforme]
MDERLLIELLEGLTGPQNDDGQLQNVLLERCIKTSSSELKEFFEELSQLLRDSPNDYLPILQTFITFLRDDSSRVIRRRNLKFSGLLDFYSKLITIVIMQNLGLSDIPGFGDLLYDSVELLWKYLDKKSASSISNKGNNNIKLTTKHLFTAILNAKGVLEVLISETPGRHCLKRILFEFNMINEIDQKELLKAIDLVISLLEKCDEHNNVSPKLLEGFSVCNACTALLESLRFHQDTSIGKNSLPPDLLEMVELDEGLGNRKRSASNSDNSPLLPIDEQHIALLKIEVPRKPADLPNFSRDLEKRKINSFKDLFGYLPCENCHKRALILFSPDKYSSLMEDEDPVDVENESKQSFRLPFEFNDTDKLGPWDILLSEDTIKDMQKLESSQMTKEVMKELVHISSGKWDKYKLRNNQPCNDIPVYEVEIPNGLEKLKILWQVDYGFSIRNHSLMQLVKIWSVTTNKNQVESTLDNLKSVHKVYTPEHNYRYKVPPKTSNSVILPMRFEDEEGTRSTNDGLYGSEMDNERLLEVHKMLVTNKFIPLSKNFVKSLILGGSGFTFNVSKIEYEIINTLKSAIIVGRSGTGKTTCIVFRLVASYLNNKICKTPSLRGNINGNLYKRQIFITVSHNLCRKVKEYFERLLDSVVLAEKELSEAEFDEYIKNKEKEDEGFDESDDNSLLEDDDEEKKQSEVPSFRDLTDDNFPLFITYDTFSAMLIKTYGIDVQKCTTIKQKPNVEADDAYDEEEEEYRSRSSLKTPDKSWFHFVDYDLFYYKYWLKFSDYYRKKFDPELVYSEFFVIKGTNPDVDYLSREDYRKISIKKFPVFRYNRDDIYDLFERYEKMKVREGDYDSVDRTLAILRAAKMKPLGGPHIHEVYIDECQDNQIVDLALILKLFNRADNIFMAGDIAQCIARGSSFRFQNLSTLMYEWELDRIKNISQRDTVAPKQFELNINYRSHNGILQLASSVIDLIHRFFPDSIDQLSRERSEVGGPRPIFFKGFRAETFLFDVFSVDEHMANCSEFGSEQVIIVRDEKAKKRVGKVGIVMTVFEAKGMEFNDVLLYNFFTDSPAGLKWRVILSALDDYSKGIQTFSHEKHYILSSELKYLYVAITRARQHLWIFDENPEFSDPIRIFWDHDGLVKVIQSLEEISALPTLVKKSSSHEWNRKGKMFFERRQYELAIFCFNKSGNEVGLKLANAYNLQKIARTSFANNSHEAIVKSNFTSAAQAFEKCSKPIQAASCYQDIGMNKEAGNVYERWDMFENAANCYLKVKMFDKAGECFGKAGKYTDAVVAYKDGGRYKEVIDLMHSHREEINEKIFRRISRLVNIHYRRENDQEMSQKALSVLPTHEEQIELLRDHAPEELLKVCEERGKFKDAAKELYSRGKFKEAADMYLRSDDEKDIIEALQCLLDLCKINVLNVMTDNMNLKELGDLYLKALEITLAKRLIRTDRLKILIEELRLYSAYLNNDLDKVHVCIQFFRKNGELDNEFRAINMWLQMKSQSDNQTEYWRERLQYLLRLCELAFPYISFVTRPQNTKKITTIYKDFEDIFLICKVENRPNKRQLLLEHPLINLIDKIQSKSGVEDANWRVYDIHDVRQTILKFLSSYIFELILDASQKGGEFPDITCSDICYKFMSCRKPDCKYYHMNPNPSNLYQRLTLACLQYMVIQQWALLYHRKELLNEEQSKKVRPAQRWWAENIIKIHFRYQSPQLSCPEVTHMVIAGLPDHTCNGLFELARKIWLKQLSKNPGDFAVMLKCMFVFQQFQYGWGIDEFDWEMSKRINLSHPSELPIGYDYFYGYYQAIPVGKRLSLFFTSLYSNQVAKAVSHVKKFIQYAIIHAGAVNMNTTDAFGDLVSLMEFKMSLIFAAGPGYCDFCLPRSYLVNYFDVFTAEPLVLPSRYCYTRDTYSGEIRYSIEQIQKLLELLIYEDQRYYLIIILRLIRLLVIIGRNEPNCTFKVISLFKSLSKLELVFSRKIMNYLEENNILRLVNILNDDLKERDCDSLVIVHYNWGGMTRFTELAKSGVVMLKYNSADGFHSSLRKIMSSVVTEESAKIASSANKLLTQRANNVSNQNTECFEDNDEDDEQFVASEEMATEIQVWFRQIQENPQALEAVKKIESWFSEANERRQKSRQLIRDQILDKIYNDTKDFCGNVSYWEDAMNQKGREEVRKYKMLLRGPTVDIVVELTKNQDLMDKIKKKLQKKMGNRSTDEEKLEICLNLEDDLKHIHFENINLALKSLSMTEDSINHKVAEIEWLRSELDQARSIIDSVLEWMNECKAVVKF